ncbi:MAG: hypothetical protein LBK07_10975 [Tannerella sp.]|jgi:hypothetical protein|nr:hypothetical protein [Tannerella sp.]
MRNSYRKYSSIPASIFLMLAGMYAAHAQMSEKAFRTEYRIDSLRSNRLFVEIDNLNFFRNVESPTVVVPGYTLPGFRLQAKAAYYASPHIRLEGGAHSIWFWGAERYPAFSYSALSRWSDGRASHVVHAYPLLRAQVALSRQVNIVLGSLYGGASHQLVEPLYNPELNLTADPETGMQLLYDTRWLHFDTWINWETFIYTNDPKQEAFTFGLSALFRCNRPESAIHVYFPLQVLARHLGGQIDTTGLPVRTALNGSAGIGMDWNVRGRTLKKIHLALDVPGYYQHAGNLWPLKRGYGIYASAAADISDFRVKAAYWECRNFISMYGNPLFGAPSMSVQDAYFVRPRTYSLGGEYVRTFAPGYTLGIDFDFHLRPSSLMHDPSAGVSPVPAKTCYSFGVYLRLNPSFLIKSF